MTYKEELAKSYRAQADEIVNQAVALAEVKAMFWKSKAEAVVAKARIEAEAKAKVWEKKSQGAATAGGLLLWLEKSGEVVKQAIAAAERRADEWRARADEGVARARAIAEAGPRVKRLRKSADDLWAPIAIIPPAPEPPSGGKSIFDK